MVKTVFIRKILAVSLSISLLAASLSGCTVRFTVNIRDDAASSEVRLKLSDKGAANRGSSAGGSTSGGSLTEGSPTEGSPAADSPTASPNLKYATVEPQVLVDRDGVVIRLVTFHANHFESSLGYPELTIEITNNTDRRILADTGLTAVNGAMIDMYLSCMVSADSTRKAAIVLDKNQLMIAGIGIFTEFCFDLTVANADGGGVIFKTDYMKIATSASASYQQVFDDRGVTVYNQNGINIVKQLTILHPQAGPLTTLYIENNSSATVSITAKNTSVNGIAANNTWSVDIMPGKVCYTTLGFSNWNQLGLEHLQVEEILVEFEFTSPDGSTAPFCSDSIAIYSQPNTSW